MCWNKWKLIWQKRNEFCLEGSYLQRYWRKICIGIQKYKKIKKYSKRYQFKSKQSTFQSTVTYCASAS